MNVEDLPETMFRTTTFDESADDEWYADWEPITVEITDEKDRVFEFEEDEHLNVWVDRD